MMITTTPSSRDVKTRKRKREVEGLSSPSVDAVSEGNLRETAPMVLARCKTAAYKSNMELRRPLEVEREIEASNSSTSEEDFKPQKINVKRCSTNGHTWEVDVGKDWVSKGHQATGKQVTGEEQDEEHLPAMVGGPRDIEGNGGLPEEVGQWISSQKTQLGHPAKG